MNAKVFVHGVPETSAIWEPLFAELAELGHSRLAHLSPPAFGAPRPDDFGATADDYRDWLISELAQFDGPVDLVGHDFGGGHTINVAISRPDLLRSWTTDVIGTLDPEYEWHALAQLWQTPGEGEHHIKELFGGSVGDRARTMQQWGIPEPAASRVAAGQDEEMGRAILTLYRSTVKPQLIEKAATLPAAAARPGLALIATEDLDVGTVEQRRRAAERAGARTATLEGLGHWWMLQNPAAAARVLDGFWRSVAA